MLKKISLFLILPIEFSNNIDLLSLNNNASSNKLFELSTSLGFLNIVNKATRFSARGHSPIDQIFKKFKKCEFETGVLVQDISDHFFTFSKLNKAKQQSKFIISFSELNILNFYNGSFSFFLKRSFC